MSFPILQGLNSNFLIITCVLTLDASEKATKAYRAKLESTWSIEQTKALLVLCNAWLTRPSYRDCCFTTLHIIQPPPIEVEGCIYLSLQNPQLQNPDPLSHFPSSRLRYRHTAFLQ